MSLDHVLFNEISERQLQSLINAKVTESLVLEYKRQTYGHSEAQHAEWLADCSSFANTAGGNIIIGIEAQDGVPHTLRPLAVNADEETTRLEQIARTGLEPRISNLSIRRVEVSQKGTVLIARIPRSYNSPHRLIKQGKGQNRFWARGTTGKYEPDVDQLRQMFMIGPQTSERIRDFQRNRITKIVAGEAQTSLMRDSVLVLHIIPLTAFNTGQKVSALDIEQNIMSFRPIGSFGVSGIIPNFDGILIPSNSNTHLPTHRAYTQVYLSGIIEAVSSLSLRKTTDGTRHLRGIDIEKDILISTVNYTRGLREIGIQLPFMTFVSIIGLKGVVSNFGIFEDDDRDEPVVLRQDKYLFDGVTLDTIPENIQDCATSMRAFLEQLANTVGHLKSSSFGQRGEYLPVF